MQRNSLPPIQSSFLSCEKDTELILNRLFIDGKQYSRWLKRLLIINNKDCLDTTNTEYQQVINSLSLGDLIERGYIKLNSKISRGTHQEIKSYILVSLDNFLPDTVSAQYRDYCINFDIICYNDAWVLNDYKIRPLMICGYIDGILNSLIDSSISGGKSYKSQIKLSGIGRYAFIGCNHHILNEDLAMYTLTYHGKHFSQDIGKIGEVKKDD